MSSLCFKFLLIGKSFSTKTKVNFEIKDKVVLIGGAREIRTLEPREGLPVFKTGVFNRSTIAPGSVLLETR